MQTKFLFYAFSELIKHAEIKSFIRYGHITVLYPQQMSPQDVSEKTDTASTPSSALSIKSSGNAFDFTTGESGADNLFGDESDADDLFSSKKPL